MNKNLIARRLNSHFPQLIGHMTPEAVVAHGLAVQAQDYGNAKWAVGLRCGASDEEVERAVCERRIVRTWALRGTLHLVAAEDLRWLLELIGPVAIRNSASTWLRRGLDTVALERSLDAIRQTLQGGAQRTRAELFAALEAQGVSTEGERGASILYHAGLSGVLCLAGLNTSADKQTRYVLIEDWLRDVPGYVAPSREAALAELARRYFNSHGPASLADFAMWSGLSLGDARIGLEGARSLLVEERDADVIYWMSPKVRRAAKPVVHLLPAFDEYFLGYADRSPVLDEGFHPQVMTNNGIFRPTLLVDGRIVGVWERRIGKRHVEISLQPFEALAAEDQERLDEAAAAYADFLSLSLVRRQAL